MKKKLSAEVTETRGRRKKKTSAAAAGNADAYRFLQTSRSCLIRPPLLPLDFQCRLSFAHVCFSALPPLRQNRLPHHSSIAPISPMVVQFDFLSASSNGRNTGSPCVVFQSLQTLDSHHAAREIAARLITPISANDLNVRRTSSSQVCFGASLFFCFFRSRLLRTPVISHFTSLPCTGSSITSAVPAGLGRGLFCDVAKQHS